MISGGKYTYFLFGSMDCSAGSVHVMAPQTEKSDFHSWPEDLRTYIQCSSFRKYRNVLEGRPELHMECAVVYRVLKYIWQKYRQ